MTDITPQAHIRWLIAFWVLLAGIAGGLAYALQNIDSHPVTFALSFSWLITVVVSATTRGALLRIDTERFCFARWEHEGRAYEWIGPGTFRWLLQRTPLGWLNPWLKLQPGPVGIECLLRETGYAEGVHLTCGLATFGFAIVGVAAGHAVVGLWLALITVLFHVWPWMLQRWNRGRVLRVKRASQLRMLSRAGTRTHT